MTYRVLLKREKELIDRLANANSKFVGDIDLDVMEVKEIDEYGSLKIRHSKKMNEVQMKLPAEAMFLDEDGVWLHALLFTCGGEIDELEYYKDDSSAVRIWPKTDEWIIDLTP
jgi:hypothetical protein